MREFAEAFLLVFAQLAVGGLFSLSIPPFQQIERGFYKSSSAVYLGAATLAVGGWTYLLVTRSVEPSMLVYRSSELGCWLVFTGIFAVYLYSLWGNPYRLRAASYAGSMVAGLVALSVSAVRYGGVSTLGGFLFPLDFIASAAILGAAGTGMLLGHWYLIDLGLTLTPFRKIHRYFVWSIHVQVVTLFLSIALLWLLSGAPVQAALGRLWEDHHWLLALRITLGPLAAYGLGWMIGRTLEVPQTMAATGLFYIAVLAVVVGEILGRTILFRTALPF